MTKIDSLIKEGVELVTYGSRTISSVAKELYPRLGGENSYDYFRQKLGAAVKGVVRGSKRTEKSKKAVEPKPFVLSAWNFETGRMMRIEEYCEFYGLPYDNVDSCKLVSHTGTPYYNILFKEVGCGDQVDFDGIKAALERELSRVYVPIESAYLNPGEGVLKWADLHFGAHIRNLALTHDYDSDVLRNGLHLSVKEVNRMGFKKTHVHINGDLIESLSGLNHINSWMSMNKDEVGANAIMVCCRIIADSLKDIVNLGCVKIIGGNHDRASKDNAEDVKGTCAELIAWGLGLMGFDVEYHPYIICHEVEGIMHINLHGDKGISKKSTTEIIWKYGKKGLFNFIFEAHLHTIIEKLSSTQRDNFKVIKDDAIDHRRMHLPSFFTGNYYSETLGYSTNGGYAIVYDNGNKRPNVFTGSL